MTASKFFFKMYELLEDARAHGSKRSWAILWRFIQKRHTFPGIPELPGEREAAWLAARRLWGHRW
ncbi:MAG: hypothetical protein A3D44_01205 [Candidatus Staskawiczbacteria bacterium RIFCSPHIGHO2_02_FULL_42_22]|uniref:Uncharacterized protein n=1 Tax=Candidatus Staskawiczbacteria bacterium RIFCSPHIGHO2_02_FULL_42_22 TaxID=1802207 RepID=A0A1G2I487_9BACT|nr:MAG: hypothetical protein A3D44_01205 [Candidatus Staskawiczbacteria bacterium RIFCSPHIGHO2_02_FULL_42_22]